MKRKKDNETTTSSMIFTFEGDGNVNALSVAKALEGLVEIVTEIKGTNYPDVEFGLAVSAISPGSLAIELTAIAEMAKTLFAPEAIQYAKTLIDLIKTSFEIKKHLKGKAPNSVSENGDSIIIESANGDRIIVPQGSGAYFINNTIDRSVSKVVQSAMDSRGVTGITLNDGKEAVTVQQNEFVDCAKYIELPEPVLSAQECESVRHNEILFIRCPDLLGTKQWEFKAMEKNIFAKIEDEEFLEKVQSSSMNILAKMYIVADVKVCVPFGADGMPDDTKCRYTVTKVHSVHTPGEGQLSI